MVLFVVCFFFFKQMTAYELRISDWSSDVCSSDLYSDAAVGAPSAKALAYVMFPQVNMSMGYDPTVPGRRPLVFPIDRNFDPYGDVVQSRDLREVATSYDPVFRAKNDVFQVNMELGLGADLKLLSRKMGRASCRESVGQYV